MAKQNPHKRKKQAAKKVSPKSVDLNHVSTIEQEAVINRQERSWSVALILAFMIFTALGIILFLVNNQNNNDIPVESPTTTQSSNRSGITIEGGGNLGQITSPATAGLQSNANPLGAASAPSNPSMTNPDQSSQLQPTVDKCSYEQFDNSLQNTCVGQ